MQTRSQELAASAYAQITQFQKASEDAAHKKYGTMAHKLPVLVRTSGLVQAISFVQTRGSEPQQELLTHLATTLGYDDVANFAADTRTHNLQDYMLQTKRVLDALLWYKRFAESILKVSQSDDSGEEQ